MASARMKAALDKARMRAMGASAKISKEFLYIFFEQHVVPILKDSKRGSWHEFMTKFDEKKTNEDRVRCLLNDQLVVTSILHLVEAFLMESKMAVKCNRKAKEAREKGNKEFGAKRYELAARHYSEAISLAAVSNPRADVSNEYALSFANRSAAFYRLNMFKECLADIKEALEHHYPLERRSIILQRKVASLKALGMDAELEQLLSSLTIGDDRGPSSVKDEKAMQFVKAGTSCNVASSSSTVPRPSVMEPKTPHSVIPGASNAVELRYSDKNGRYFVARKVVKPSEILFAEAPFAHWLDPCFYDSYCFQCMKKLNLYHVPCRNCSAARFCSKICADEAWNKYHKIECSNIDVFKWMYCEQIALRCLCTAGFENAMDWSERDPPRFEDAATDYERFLTLVDHSEHATPIILLTSTSVAVFMTLLVQKFPAVQLPEDRVAVFAGLMMKHMLQLKANLKSIYHDEGEMVNDYRKIFWNDGINIGAGVYCALSLLNHSCGEVTYYLYRGSTVIAKAVDRIRAGEEVAGNYGFHYKSHSWEDRQSKLEKYYHFTCKCSFCSSKLEYLGKAWKCLQCSGPAVTVGETIRCTKCTWVSEIPSIMPAVESFLYTAVGLFNADRVLDSSKLLFQNLELATLHLWREHHKIAEIYDRLSACAWQLRDVKGALRFATLAHAILRKLHGPNNYDVLGALLSLAFLSLNAGYETGDAKGLMKYYGKAKQYYAEAEQIYGRIKDKEFCVLIAKTDSIHELALIPIIAQQLSVEPFSVNLPPMA